MAALPSLFVSHGAPMLVLQPGPAHHFLKQLGPSLGKPKAILCITAHWETQHPTLSSSLLPKTIHVGRFPDEVLQLRYPALGDPTLAFQVAELLTKAGIDCQVNGDKGLDRGTWIPLMLMYPDAIVPVVQLSVQPQLSLSHHLAVGRALEPLRHQNVLILGSGSATHNLRAMSNEPNNTLVPDWVTEFERWLVNAVMGGQIDSLLNYPELAPWVERNHPTTEHLLPLFVALGAGGADPKPTHLHSSYTYSALSMTAFSFV